MLHGDRNIETVLFEERGSLGIAKIVGDHFGTHLANANFGLPAKAGLGLGRITKKGFDL